MEELACMEKTISATDLINLSSDLAQINAEYLAVAVTVLVVFGGAFYLFNFKPLKDTLEKQESNLEAFKKELQALIPASEERSKNQLIGFEKQQSKSLSDTLRQESEKLLLETENRIATSEKVLSERMEVVAENKDLKLKSALTSETENRINATEKALISEMNRLRQDLSTQIVSINELLSRSKSDIKTLSREIKELNVFRYGSEGKMGELINTIELLTDEIDDKASDWRITNRLEKLHEIVSRIKVESEYVVKIEEQLLRVEKSAKFRPLIENIRKLLN